MLPVQRPAEIVNYRTMGTAPLVLRRDCSRPAAVVALALTLAAAARRRSRDLRCSRRSASSAGR